MNYIDMRQCTRCFITKPATQFYIRRVGKRLARCKDCHKGETLAWRHANIELARARVRASRMKMIERRDPPRKVIPC